SQLVVGARFSPDDHLLTTCSSDGLIKLWQVTGPEAGTCLATLEGHNAEVLAAEFSPDGRFLASSSSAGDVWLWDLTYFDRSIAGNLEYQVSRIGTASLDPRAVSEARSRVGSAGTSAKGNEAPDH